METVEDNIPGCALKCLRNVEDVSHSVHPLKYGVVRKNIQKIITICNCVE